MTKPAGPTKSRPLTPAPVTSYLSHATPALSAIFDSRGCLLYRRGKPVLMRALLLAAFAGVRRARVFAQVQTAGGFDPPRPLRGLHVHDGIHEEGSPAPGGNAACPRTGTGALEPVTSHNTPQDSTWLTSASSSVQGRPAEIRRPGPGGLAFYMPPSPLPGRAGGRVIWSRRLTGAAALPGAAENLLILYHSTTVAGQDTAVSGTVSIPPGQPPADGWPVLSWAHGATGIADICAPSRDAPGHPSHIYNQLADAMLKLWVTRGWVVTKTDYEGLGTPGAHPYLVGASAARSVVDIVLAARQLHRGIGKRWVVIGHSQGGHAALFTASLAPALAPDLDLTGAVAMSPAGGAHHMIAALRDILTPALSPGFLALVLTGAAAADRAVRLDQMLTPAGLRLLARAEDCGIDDLIGLGSPPPPAAAAVVRPGADLGPLLRVLVANDPAALRLRTPALIVQGDADPIVAHGSTDHIVRSLHASGELLSYHKYPGYGHFDLIAAAHTKTAKWIDTQLAKGSHAGLHLR